jgi:hypothetical protein
LIISLQLGQRKVRGFASIGFSPGVGIIQLRFSVGQPNNPEDGRDEQLPLGLADNERGAADFAATIPATSSASFAVMFEAAGGFLMVL